MAQTFRLMLAQMNPVLGDLVGNAALARRAWGQGKVEGCDFVALTEMFLTGYQTGDLILKPAFLEAAQAALCALAEACAEGPVLGIGAPFQRDGRIYNAYHILDKGRISTSILKHHLPNMEVFTESRLFAAGEIHGPYTIGPLRIGTPICEDSWHVDVCETLAETGADLILSPNGSPYHRGKQDERLNAMVGRVTETGLPLVYLNMVGGQDDQIFDGGSMVLNAGGHLAVQMPMFEECLTSVTFTQTATGWQAAKGLIAPLADDTLETDYRACLVALADYMGKTGFRRALLGLSGGVDSALVAAMACDALGADNLRCILLPSEHTSAQSNADAIACAEALGCSHESLGIASGVAAVEASLAPFFTEHSPDVTEENIQSRLRGLLLMALSNKFGDILLTTGNKSEMAVGYCTLYGDMNGGYNPLKDLYKTRIYDLVRWRNSQHRPWMRGPAGVVIPDKILTKAPSAELRADQTDQDSLPPYDVLDAILEGLVERDGSVADLVARGYDAELVRRIEHLLYISEYKRAQSAPGPRLSRKTFGGDRRYPIVNNWRDRGA